MPPRASPPAPAAASVAAAAASAGDRALAAGDRALAAGDRVLVPREMWPDFACDENGGAGWTASVVGTSRGT